MKFLSLVPSLVFCLSIVRDSSESCDDILVTDFSQRDCVAKQTDTDSFYYWLDETQSCFPTCKKYKPEGHFRDSCAKVACPPAYSCSKRCNRLTEYAQIECQTNADCTRGGAVRAQCVDMCVTDEHTCMAYHANTTDFRDKEFGALKFKPSCSDDGQWESKQCKGGVSGKCYCYDRTGKKLFGQAAYPKSKDMTCACSRRRAELQASGRPFVGLHCDATGNFEPLQCDSGLCWCAAPATGALLSAVVPERAAARLPCYDPAALGGQYLRRCESRRYAVARIASALRRHGAAYVGLSAPECDGDGAFGAYDVSGGIAYCTWRDGTKIGTWQSDAGAGVGALDCNCARDYKMYEHRMRCGGAGNYDRVQDFVEDGRSYFYCVDEDGFAVTDYFTERIDNCTSYY